MTTALKELLGDIAKRENTKAQDREFIDLLRDTPSFSPQTGIQLLKMREELWENAKKRKLSLKDQMWVIAYANALKTVADCGIVHTAVPIATLKAFVDRGKIERTLQDIEDSGKGDNGR